MSVANTSYVSHSTELPVWPVTILVLVTSLEIWFEPCKVCNISLRVCIAALNEMAHMDKSIYTGSDAPSGALDCSSTARHNSDFKQTISCQHLAWLGRARIALSFSEAAKFLVEIPVDEITE